MELPARYDSLIDNRGHAANYVPLTPIAFLPRTADIYPDRTSVVYGDRQYTWRETEARCQAMAHGLKALGLGAFDTVSVLAFNTPELFEAHFAVPLAGGVLNTINTRLDADTISYIAEFAEARVVMVDRELFAAAESGIRNLLDQGKPLSVIVINDANVAEPAELPDDIEWIDSEALIESHPVESSDYLPAVVSDELAPLAINFTSGTSGRPKGVVYHHRGSYLMSFGTVAGWAVPRHPVYLYLVPMFHCNGWGHAWTMTAMAGTIICARAVIPDEVFGLIKQYDVTHFGGAPIVLNMLANAPNCPETLREQGRVQCMTAGAPPPASVLARMADMGCDIMHVYGLTETYGHVLQATPREEWDTLSQDEVAELKARQGVRFPMAEAVQVFQPGTLNPVPWDGESMGEIAIRANVVMSGYLKDAESTADSFRDGWFWSGDLAVIYPDGYLQVKDRAKDIIISGGENISSVEIENALYKHPAVNEAAVIAIAHEKWGETPCACVDLKVGAEVSEEEIIAHCAALLASFKKPTRVVFGPLPKTATGKIQKYALRATLNSQT